MKMNVFANLVYRVPQFSYNAELSTEWEILKQSISRSSESFYELVRDLRFEDLERQPEGIRNTIWKYFNRAKFRATPYGSFANVGTATIRNDEKPFLTLNQKQILHEFYNWPVSDSITFTFQELLDMDVCIWSNNSWYQVGTDIRYTGHFKEGYALVDKPIIPGLIEVLKCCEFPIKISSVITVCTNHDQEPLLELVERLLDEQLLLCEMHPNIIGTDYFERINFRSSKPESKYLIAERKVTEGCFSPGLFRHLPELLSRLQQLLPPYYSTDLEQFKTRFLSKFGEREMPLVVALDPELGVGYAGMEEAPNQAELIRSLSSKVAIENEDDSLSTIQLFLPFLMSDQVKEIDLEKLRLPELPKGNPLPNTLPVLCTIADRNLYVEHIGGSTANSLLGRFTHVNAEIFQQAKDIAAIEEKANPNVEFFDLGYLVGNHVDNVNRRKAIYSKQLNLLNYDTSADPLNLNELMICVQQNELVLHRKGSNKRLIPKLATAYNYLLSDLPAFRFLCDLQHQGIHKNLYLRLRDRLPGLDYYPQIRFRNIILSPATWKVEWKLFEKLPHEEVYTSLIAHLHLRSVAGIVKAGSADQTLVFQFEKNEDIDALLQLLKKEKELYLEEIALPTVPVISDHNSAPYLPQAIVTCFHNQEIYSPYRPSLIKCQDSEDKTLFMPADDWLYFEIYSHQMRVDEILNTIVSTIITQQQDVIQRWFFIRYSENGHHIRLRLKVIRPVYIERLICALNSSAKDAMATGTISDILIRPYRREIERYGSKHITIVEAHFQTDSHYVLQAVQMGLTDEQKYLNCLDLLNEILYAELFEVVVFVSIINNNCNRFNQEHHLGPAEFKLLNDYVKKLDTVKHNYESEVSVEGYKDFVNSFNRVLKAYTPIERPELFSSLFHMHVNRLFPSLQRTHETLIYYMATKYQQRAFRKNTIVSD